MFYTDTSEDDLLGVVAFAPDPDHTSRVVIYHFSGISSNILSPILAKSLHYIWENYECKEIRIPLNYYQVGGVHVRSKARARSLIKSSRTS